jgi:mannitol/fructose-specific phosphotransferase system IIA component (Ntr-type)
MNVQNLLSEKTININLKANDKHEAISKMVDLIAKSNIGEKLLREHTAHSFLQF